MTAINLHTYPQQSMKQGDHADERRDLKPKGPLEIGEQLFERGDYEKAEQAFWNVLKDDPENVQALNNLGVIAWTRQDQKKAIEYFAKSLEIDPSYKEAVFNFTDVLKSLKLLREAAPFLEKVAAQHPYDEEIKHLFGEAKITPSPKTTGAEKRRYAWKLCCSPGVSQHGENARKMLSLEHYDPIKHHHEPVWFFGLYFDDDYMNLRGHHGKKIVNWRGADVLRMFHSRERLRIIKETEALHVCQARHQIDLFAQLGIESIVRPMMNTPFDEVDLIPFFENGTGILVYWRSGDDKYIQADMFFEIASKCPDTTFHIVGKEDASRFNKPGMENIQFHGYISEEELDRLMDQCKGTIRPWFWDGNPNIQTKMILKGRYAAHSLKFEEVALCRTVDDYVRWVNELREIREPNYNGRRWWLEHINNFDFLDADFHHEYQ